MKTNTVVHQLLQVSSSSSEGETEEGAVARIEEPPPNWNVASGARTGLSINKRRLLSKQLSMRETRMEAKWEKRRSQILEKRCAMERGVVGEGVGDEAAAEGDERRLNGKTRSLTDEDLDELRGSIDLGFGFSEEEGGQDLCDTLPALNLYFAVNRQLSDPKIQLSPSPASTPDGHLLLIHSVWPPEPAEPERAVGFLEDLQSRRQSAARENKIEALGTSSGLFSEAELLMVNYTSSTRKEKKQGSSSEEASCLLYITGPLCSHGTKIWTT